MNFDKNRDNGKVFLNRKSALETFSTNKLELDFLSDLVIFNNFFRPEVKRTSTLNKISKITLVSISNSSLSGSTGGIPKKGKIVLDDIGYGADAGRKNFDPYLRSKNCYHRSPSEVARVAHFDFEFQFYRHP